MWLLSEPTGPIEKGTTYIVRPCIVPLKSSSSWERISPGSRQLFVGPASSSLRGADEGAVLDAGDVARVGERQVAVRTDGVVETLERPSLHEHLAESVVLLAGAVTPVDCVGLGE